NAGFCVAARSRANRSMNESGIGASGLAGGPQGANVCSTLDIARLSGNRDALTEIIVALGLRVRARGLPSTAIRTQLRTRLRIYSSLGVFSSTAPGSVRDSTNTTESMKRPGSGEATSPLAGSTVASNEKSLPLVK